MDHTLEGGVDGRNGAIPRGTRHWGQGRSTAVRDWVLPGGTGYCEGPGKGWRELAVPGGTKH